MKRYGNNNDNNNIFSLRQGREYDGEGRLQEWWTPATDAGYRARSSCIADQFSQYKARPRPAPSLTLFASPPVPLLRSLLVHRRPVVPVQGAAAPPVAPLPRPALALVASQHKAPCAALPPSPLSPLSPHPSLIRLPSPLPLSCRGLGACR